MLQLGIIADKDNDVTNTCSKMDTISTPPTQKDGMGAGAAGATGGVGVGGDMGFAIPDDYGLSGEGSGKKPKINMIDEDGQLVEVQAEVKAETLANLPEQTEPEGKTYTYTVTPIENTDGSATLEIETLNITEVVVKTPNVICRTSNDDVMDADFTEAYMSLPPSSQIRQRAESLDKTYRAIGGKRWKAQTQYNSQRRVAADLIDPVRTLQSALVGFQNSESQAEKTIKAQRAQVIYESMRSLLNNNNLNANDLSSSLGRVVRTVDATPLSSINAVDGVIGDLDDSISELEEVSQRGSYPTVSEFTEAVREFEQVQADVERMKRDVKTALYSQSGTMQSLGGKKSMGDKIAIKQNYRLLDEAYQSDTVKVEGPIPSNVPNYRLAIDASPRLCGNCRFFKGTDDPMYGDCTAFDFSARPNYLCDAWQSPNLTTIHTAVRTAAKNNSAEGDYPLHTKTPIIPVHGEPHERNGVVEGVVHPIIALQDKPFDLQVAEEYNAPQEPEPNAAMRNTTKDFLPGDVVFSKSLNSLAVVDNVAMYEGSKMYGLKLIDGRGVSHGSGFSYGSDLQLRGKSAVKSPHRSTKMLDADLNNMIDTVRSVYKAIKAVVEGHQDLKSAPLSNKDVIAPLLSDVVQIMTTPEFTNITTGPGRKYYRAIQNSMVSLGAARQVLFEGYKVINYLKRNDTSTKSNISDVMMKAQTDCYARVKEALRHVEDALLLPSATHETEAPGTE